MNKFEYREPEFKVIVTAKEDILTASGETPAGLNAFAKDWDTANGVGGGTGGVSFGV